MTKKPKKVPRPLDEINKEIDNLWISWKEIGSGKYKHESAAFRRALRHQHKGRFNDLYNEMADREFLDREVPNAGRN